MSSGDWSLMLKSVHDSLEKDCINVAAVREILERYKSREDDWEMFAKFDDTKYTRNLIDSGDGNYNVLVLAWGPGQASHIHDHGESACFVKILRGTVTETRYKMPDGNKIERIEETSLGRDQVIYIDNKIGVHKMVSGTDGRTVTLHLYTPPIEVCSIFDPENGKASSCEMNVYSVQGEVVEEDDDESHTFQPRC